MATWEEILADEENFAGDMELQVNGPDGNPITVTLGDLRKKNKGYEADYTRKTQRLADERRQLDQRSQEIAEATNQINDQKRALQAEIQGMGATRKEAKALTEAIWDWANPDPYIKPVVEKFKTVEDGLVRYGNDNRVLFDTVRQMVQWATRREIQRDWDAIADRFEDVTLETVRDHAFKNRLVDEIGYPDIRRSYNDLTGDRQRQSLIEQAEKKGEEKGRKEAAAPVVRRAPMSRPGTMAGGKPVAKQYRSKGGTFRSLFEDIIQGDPDIRDGIANAGWGVR